MPGFLGTLFQSYPEIFLPKIKIQNQVFNQAQTEGFKLQRSVIPKFINDKIFFEDENLIITMDGVILNDNLFLKRYGCEKFTNCVIKMYNELGETFYTDFRGSFSGCVYEKKRQKLLVFADHIGSKFVYFYHQNGILIFGSDLTHIVKTLAQNDLPHHIDEMAVQLMLTYGHMIEDITPISEIKKMLPGHYLVYQNDIIKDVEYFTLSNVEQSNMTEKEAVERMDQHFRNGIRLAFEKDRREGYKHLVTLSAGLDSRLTNAVAHDMGYGDQITNITMSQTGFYDEEIPKAIAGDLRHDWLFCSLDSGHCLQGLEESIKTNGGVTLFSGSCHSQFLFKNLNADDFGIIHTGVSGDVIFGTFYKDFPEHIPANYFPREEYSGNKIEIHHLIKNIKLKRSYPNNEIFKFYQRCFTAVHSGLLPWFSKVESYSPFTDVDTMQFALTMPLKFRYNHFIYDQFILSRYPDVAKYLHNGKYIIGNRSQQKASFHLFGKHIFIKDIPNIIKHKLWNIPYPIVNIKTKHHMNPLDYWYDTFPKTKTFIDSHYHENIDTVQSQSIKSLMQLMYESGSFHRKAQVLTVLMWTKIYNLPIK